MAPFRGDSFVVFNVLFFILAIQTASAYNELDLCDRNMQNTKSNFYVFGSSYTDWGNWKSYIMNHGIYTLDANNIIQPPTNWYNSTQTSTNIINSKGRGSDGDNAMDFIANYYNLQKYSGVEIFSFPAGVNFMVNYAIFGATHNGNMYNHRFSIGVPVSLEQLTGGNGYDAQVGKFLYQLSQSSLTSIGPNDVFIYDFVGGTDMPFIAQCSDITTCIGEFETTHLNNLQQLYNVGMRNLLFIHLDSLFHLVPSFIKYDTFQMATSSSDMNVLANAIFNPTSFFSTLASYRTSHMPLLNLQRISYQDILGQLIYTASQNGLRNSNSDDPDPRAVAFPGFITPGLPFPTKWDYYKQNHVSLGNVAFNDDNQPTEFTYRIMAKSIINYIRGMVKSCS